jgi:hypothetical protein
MGGGNFPSYEDLMMQTDFEGRPRCYLASEAAFGYLKSCEEKNLLVPLVGDFAGPKALRALGAYLKEHSATVTAFYVSNVEDYLQGNGVWPQFCANVASMPLDQASVFIRPSGGRSGSFGPMAAEVAGCVGK